MATRYSDFYTRSAPTLQATRTLGFWPSTLEVELRELVRIRSAQVNDCAAEATSRVPEARELGLTEAKIGQLGDVEHSGLSEREKVAVTFVERFSLNWSSIDSSFQARMQAAFTQAEIAELCWFVVTFTGAHRVQGIFDVDPPEYEVGDRVQLDDGTWLTLPSDLQPE